MATNKPKHIPRKTKGNPRSAQANTTAAQRRKQRSEADALRAQLNPPQIVSEIKGNLRKLKKMLKPGYYADESPEAIEAINTAELKVIEASNKTNLALLRFVMPTLKSVELKGHEGPLEIIVRLPDVD